MTNIPEKWVIYRDGNNNEIINNYFNVINNVTSFSSKKAGDYVHFPKFYSEFKKKESNTNRFVKKGYTLISTKQFKQFFLKDNTMKRKIIGYAFKPGMEKYEAAATQIAHTSPNGKFDSFINEWIFPYISDSANRLKEAGVLDLWFDAVYELEFKIGDKVVVHTDSENGHPIGNVVMIYDFYNNNISAKLINSNGNIYGHSLKNLRKATQQEIENSKKVLIGNYPVMLRSDNTFVCGCQNNITRDNILFLKRLLGSKELSTNITINGTSITLEMMNKILKY